MVSRAKNRKTSLKQACQWGFSKLVPKLEDVKTITNSARSVSGFSAFLTKQVQEKWTFKWMNDMPIWRNPWMSTIVSWELNYLKYM